MMRESARMVKKKQEWRGNSMNGVGADGKVEEMAGKGEEIA